MGRSCLVVAAAIVVSVAAGRPHAQSHPSFSGSWVRADVPSSQGVTLTVIQDAKTLTLIRKVDMARLIDAMRRVGLQVGEVSSREDVYQIGGETRTISTVTPGGGGGIGPYRVVSESSVSRAEWAGDALVIVTHTTMQLQDPARTTPDLTRERLLRDVLRLDRSGQLTDERVAILDPFPSAVQAPAPLQSVTTVDKKAS